LLIQKRSVHCISIVSCLPENNDLVKLRITSRCAFEMRDFLTRFYGPSVSESKDLRRVDVKVDVDVVVTEK